MNQSKKTYILDNSVVVCFEVLIKVELFDSLVLSGLVVEKRPYDLD